MIAMLRAVLASLRVRRRARRARRLEARAVRRRRLLDGRPVIAVTGAAAKSTTVKLLVHLLGGPPRIASTVFSNDTPAVFTRLARVDPAAAMLVSEVSEHPVGTLAQVGGVLRPTMAVLTISGLDHFTAFRTQAASAAEIATLARAVPAGGAVLVNADDACLVEAVAAAGVPFVGFGTGPAADYRAIDCRLGSDLSLSLTCLHAGEEIPLRTRLVGTHFHVPVLAAVAAAHRLGIPWREIAGRVASFEPVFGRCSPLAVPGGPTFICDTIKAPAWSCEQSLAVLDACADAPRRTLVFGTLSDYAGDSRRNYRRVLRNALRRVDRVIFLRHSPRHVGATAADVAAGRVAFFDDVRSIASHVRRTAVPGEVILVKGSFKADHLERIAFDFLAPVRCWEEKCGRPRTCLACDRLGAPADFHPVIPLDMADRRRHAA
ncbi:MAG: Mur ligase family protein [Planctomycetaceae bacterium]